jgi:hypothetical protein
MPSQQVVVKPTAAPTKQVEKVAATMEEHKPVPSMPAMPAATAVPEVKAAVPDFSKKPSLPVAPESKAVAKASADDTPVVVVAADENSGVSVLQPIAADEASAVVPESEVESTAEAAMDNIIKVAHPDRAPAPFLAAGTLGHITSVDCLTETIKNGGHPCNSDSEIATPASQMAKSPVTPAKAVVSDSKSPEPPSQKAEAPIVPAKVHQVKSVAEVVVTNANMHPVKSVTQVVSRSAPARLRAHHQDHVAQVTEVKTVQHHKHPGQSDGQIQRDTEAMPARSGSMADLVSQSAE